MTKNALTNESSEVYNKENILIYILTCCSISNGNNFKIFNLNKIFDSQNTSGEKTRVNAIDYHV